MMHGGGKRTILTDIVINKFIGVIVSRLFNLAESAIGSIYDFS